MTSFQDIINLQKELDVKLKTFGKSAFVEAFAPFFAANPAIESIHWSQYTPYFNDGDVCLFSVHEPRVVLTIEAARTRAEAAGEEFDEEAAADDYFGYDHPRCLDSYEFDETDFPGFDAAWNQIPESIFLAAFGDHVEVTVNRDGTVEVNECEHD